MIARETAYHGTTMGALAITGVAALRSTVRAADARHRTRPNTNRFRHPLGKATTPRSCS